MRYADFDKKYKVVSDTHNDQDHPTRKRLCVFRLYDQCSEVIRLREELKKQHTQQIARINQRLKVLTKHLDGLIADPETGFIQPKNLEK